MSLFEEIIAEIFVEIIWEKIIKSIFYFTGVGLRLVFNFKRLTYADIRKKDNNSIIGFIFLAIVITAFFVIRAKFS